MEVFIILISCLLYIIASFRNQVFAFESTTFTLYTGKLIVGNSLGVEELRTEVRLNCCNYMLISVELR